MAKRSKMTTKIGANQKYYTPWGTRIKEMEHGHGLLPAYIYPDRIARIEAEIAKYEKLVADNPDMTFYREWLRRERLSLSMTKRNQARALAWEQRRDENEANHTEEKALARTCVKMGIPLYQYMIDYLPEDLKPLAILKED